MQRGTTHTPEAKAQISAALMGNNNPAKRQKARARMKGDKNVAKRPEVRAKLRLAAARRWGRENV
jgi:hypothetical protein